MWALRLWPLLPALFLLIHRERFADLYGLILGLDATLCLIACITITPLMTVAKLPIARLRWWYGVWMFALGVALALGTIILDTSTVHAMAGNSVNWTGLVIVLILLPMTITANTVSQKALGPEWKRWQRYLMWIVWTLVGLHLAALMAWPTLTGYLAATLPLIILRRARASIKAWRAGQYSTGGWWAGLAILLSVYLAGLTILITELVQACAQTV